MNNSNHQSHVGNVHVVQHFHHKCISYCISCTVTCIVMYVYVLHTSDSKVSFCQISMPAVRDYLYQNLTELSETQHNIMHAVYLIILAHHDQDDSDIFSMAENVFKTLFNKHFMEKMEVHVHVHVYV